MKEAYMDTFFILENMKDILFDGCEYFTPHILKKNREELESLSKEELVERLLSLQEIFS